ncbi:YSIRK-type signal peptide-containing protein, partial [Staphylococcus piscifermentans]
MKKLDFLPNLKNKYSIRKFTVGTASILIGSLLFLGHDGDAQAAEDTSNDSVAEVSADNTETQQSSQEIEKVTPETTPQDISEDKVESPLEKDKSQEASQVVNQPKSDEEANSSAKETEEAASKELSSDKKDEVQSSNNTKVQQEQSVSKEKVQPETESKPKEDTTVTEKKATESSQPVQKSETAQFVSQENKVIEPVISNKTETITTEQKVEKVKTELGSEHEEAAINEALGKIDAENLSSEQIKAEILKLLVKQGSAQRDLYSPQATLNNSEENGPKYAVRAFQVDTSAKDQVVVTKDNFNDYFWTVDNASYDEKTGIATLTPDESSKKGSVSLDTKLNVNKDFHFSGAVNLGDKGEGHPKNGLSGGDGIAFVFNPGNTHELGLYGSALGIGGLKYAFGFKLDTYVNNSPKAAEKAGPDPKIFDTKGAFGAFVWTDASSKAITSTGTGTGKAALLNAQPEDNKFRPFTIDYDGDTKDMTVTYAGQTWKQNMQSYINYSHKDVFALSISASTGGAHNLQQVRIDKFTYTASALLEEDYVDQDTQELIGTPLRTSGDIDEVITLIERPDYLTEKGYKLVSKDTRLAPDYTAANNSVKLTNASQFIVYTVKDIEAPKIGDIANVSSNVSEPINPIKLNITDNSGHFKSKTVTGLPEGLTFNETTNEITGTPTKIGSSTVTVTATDNANLSTTKTFTYTVADAVAPEITAVENKTSEAYTPITPITLNATDNSGAVPTLEVTGLPAGLSYDDKTKQITGTPTAVGQSEVTIKATDASNNSSTTKFNFTVEANKALEALKQAVQEAKGLDKTPYTSDSVQALNNKVNEGDQLISHPENGSNDLFKQKTDEINQAKAQLSTEADKTELIKAIEKAATLGQLNDADKEDKAVKDKLAVANEVKTNKNATKDQVDTATNDLNTAINDKLYHDALDRLNAAINDAKTVNQSEYKPSTVAPFSKALTDGEAKATDKTATPDQLDKAAKAITDAKAQLQRAADKQALEAAINKAKALGTLNEADKEDKGVKDALTSGETVKNNNDASQQQVADATKALNDAIEAKEHADALDALKAKLAEVAGLDKATYTPNTVTPLNEKETAGKAVVAAEKSKTTDEIKAATEALTNAQNALVKKANKTELEKAITKAEGFTQLNPQKPMDKQLQDTLTAAKAVDADDNATQQATDTNKDQLNKAILEKERADAYERLQAAVAKGAQVASSEGFTPDSVQKVKDVIQEVNPLVMASMSDDPAEKDKYDVAAIDAATKKINDSVDSLVKKADKTELQKAIDRAGTLGTLEAADKEDKAVQDKLTAANQVKDNGNVTPQEVANATNDLNKAIDQKLYQDALDELNAAIKDGEGLDKTAYTPDSVTPFEASLTAGKTKAADKNATPDQLKAATQAIKDAKDALKQKANKDELNNSITAAEALQPLQPGNPLDDAVKNALDKAKAVQGNQNVDQPAVDAAKTELDNAVNAKKAQDAKDAAAKQAALDELKAELAKVAKIDKNNFTPDTVTPLTEKETAGQAIVDAPQDKTVDEIKAATKALQDAEKALQAKSDKAALQAAIDKAEAIKDLNPADVEDKAVQDKLAEAKAVKNNDNASQQAVQDATKALNDAVAAKEHADALDALKAELKKVEGLNKDTYTPDSVTPLTEKETEGKAIVAAADTKSTDEIKKATDALKAAEAGLVNKANKDELQKAIDKADALKDLDAADKEDKAVQDKLAEAKNVKGNDNATPEQVQAATQELNDAVAAKERQDALDELQKAIDAAKAINKDDYTPNSVTPLDAAVKAGETAKADTAKTPAELKEAAKAIKDAQDALQAKANKDGLNNSIQTAEGLQPLVAGDAEDDAVKAALEKAKTVQANQNADQPTVDAAKAELDNAIKAKQDQDAKEKADAAKAKEDALKELQAELEKVAKIDKNKYTPDSVTPLTEKQTAGQAIVDAPDAKTTEEIKAATQALKDAEKALQPKSDKAALEAAIDKAIALGDLDENDKEDKAVKDALTAGQVVDGDGNATPEQVQNATKALNDALEEKERQDALDELQKALDDAAKVKQEDYKPNTVTPFDAAIKAGETAKADAAKTPEELKAAAKAIKDAQAALQAKADKEGLNNSITAAEALQPLKAGDAEDDAVKAALEKAKEVQADQNTDQATVDAAKAALDNAVNAKKAADAKEAAEAADAAKAKQDALDALKAELAKVEKLNKDDFTPNTVNPLNEKETAGKDIVANSDDKTADEIKAATDALKAAETGLVNKANKEELQKAIDKAEALKDLNPADTEDKAVQDKLAEAQTVKANDNATPEQVQAATNALNDALAAKERQDALDELQKALDAANAVNKDAYTPNSVAPLDAAVQAGATAKADAAKTPEELKAAAKAINDAKDALQAKADKAELDKAVTTAEGLGNLDPADAEDKAVKDALDKAKEVQADQNADQPTVDAAKDALNQAIDAKKAADAKEKADATKAKQDALDALKAELEKVEKLNKDEFTPNSVTPLNEKETAGKAVVADADNKSIDEIKEATQALKDAEDGLVKRADKGDLEKAIDKAEALGELDTTDTEDKAVQDAITAGQTVKDNADATSEQVAKATKDINDAVAVKEYQDALDELNRALDAANAVAKDKFTPETVSPLEDAVKDGETLKNDTTKRPEELKDAALEIQEAIKALHAKADKEGLNNSIQTAEGLGNLDPADAEDKAVKDALDKAKEVQADQNANQTAVDKAKEDLDNVIKAKQDQDAKEKADAAKAKQDALDALKAELAKVKALDKDTFTPDTVAPLNEKETAGDAVVANADNKSIDEIKEATQALKDAEDALVKRADKGDLEKAIEKANALGQLDAADAEDKAVQDAIATGQAVKDNANATPEQVAKATKDINDAVAAKERQDALEELNKAIDAAQKVEKADYTAQSVEPLEKAKEAGQKLAVDNQATPEQLKDAAKLINDAINQLVPDKAELAKQIEAAKAFEPLNDTATDQLLKHALDAAVAVQNNPNATPQEIKEATWNLEDEIANKIAADAIEALKNAVNKANALKEENYTPNSYAPLKTATTESQSILDDPSSADVPTTLAKAKEINQLIDALKEKADKTALEQALDKAVAFENLDDKDAEDKAVHDALLAGQEVEGDLNATPEEVQKATENLNNALAAKEHADALDELQKAIDAANAVAKDSFTPNSVKPLEDAVKAGETTKADAANKTPEELKEAAKAINDAKAALQAKADKDGLNNSIQTAEGLGNLEPTDAEDKAVKDALDKAKAVQADQNADQAAVDTAKTELDNAIKAKQDQDAKDKADAAKAKQDALDELKAELEKVAKINKDNFTPASVTPLTNKEDEGKAIVAAPDTKSTEEIKATTQALKDAEKALQAKSDKAALQAAIDKAVALKDLDAADKEDKAVQDKLAEAQTVKSNDNATQEQVQAATQALNDALAAKEHADALDELNKALDAANAVVKDNFTPDSVKPLEEAVKAGETVKADAANKTPEELKEAAKAINDAKDALQAKADKDGLNNSIQTAEGLGNLDSEDAEDKVVKDALDKAKEVQADQNADQTAVDKAKAELDKAIKAKQDQDAKEKVDAAKAKQDALDALKAELAKVEKLDKDEFAPNTVAPLTEKETAGKAIVDAPTGKTVEEINRATQAVKDALAGLQAKADKAELGKSIEKAENI